jgi:LmbE family N-acetylglucosaminyl deacetylase
MQIEKLSQLDGYEYIYLSPHLDDAALACGGMLAAQRAAGRRVLVVTVCTASPAPDAQFNALTLEFHRRWGLAPAEVVAARLREEQHAMALLDADSYAAGMLDSIYRHPAAYDSRAALFGTPAPDDPLLPMLLQLIRTLRERMPGARIYAPLGIGMHVDHQIVYTAARDILGDAALYYEDIPYATRPGLLEQRLVMLEGHFSPQVITIDATLEQKLAAIKAYASQLEQFGGADAMERTMRDYAQSLRPVGGVYGERLWAHEGVKG